MKLKHYINLFLLFAITPAFAQEKGAQINFETTTIDYGTLPMEVMANVFLVLQIRAPKH